MKAVIKTILKSLIGRTQSSENNENDQGCKNNRTYTPGPNGSMMKVLKVNAFELNEYKLILKPDGTVEEAVFILDRDESPAHSPS